MPLGKREVGRNEGLLSDGGTVFDGGIPTAGGSDDAGERVSIDHETVNEKVVRTDTAGIAVEMADEERGGATSVENEVGAVDTLETRGGLFRLPPPFLPLFLSSDSSSDSSSSSLPRLPDDPCFPFPLSCLGRSLRECLISLLLSTLRRSATSSAEATCAGFCN